LFPLIGLLPEFALRLQNRFTSKHAEPSLWSSVPREESVTILRERERRPLQRVDVLAIVFEQGLVSIFGRLNCLPISANISMIVLSAIFPPCD